MSVREAVHKGNVMRKHRAMSVHAPIADVDVARL